MSGQIYGVSQDIPVVQGFLASAIKGTGLTVTVQVLRDGVSLIAAGQATAEVGSTGFYLYTIPLASTGVAGVYTVIFTTTGTADQKVLAQTVQVHAALDTIDDIFTSVGADIVGDIGDVATDTTNAAADSAFIKAIIEDFPGIDAANIPSYKRIGAAVDVAMGTGVYSFDPPARANAVLVQVSVHDAYLTIDGTTPSATVGFVLVDSALPFPIPLKRNTIKALRSASGSLLHLQYIYVNAQPFAE